MIRLHFTIDGSPVCGQANAQMTHYADLVNCKRCLKLLTKWVLETKLLKAEK